MKPSVYMSGLFAVCAAGVLAACGGGNGSNQPPVVNVLVQPTPTPTPVPAFNQSSTMALATSTPIPFPGSNGFSGTVTVPSAGTAVPAGTTITVTLTDQLPSGVPSLPNTLAFLGLKASNTVSIGAGTVFKLSIPLYYLPPSTPLAVDCLNGTWNLCVGPIALPADNSTTLTTFTAPFAFTLNGGVQYWYALTLGAPATVVIP